MRKLQYLSPTSLASYEADKEEFYLRYLADNLPPRPQQNKSMSVGSSFDAYIKDYLSVLLGGEPLFEKLFEKQVEEQNRDFALDAGKMCFLAYKTSGMLADLIEVLERGTDHDFEIKVMDTISAINNKSDFVLYGKPDLLFRVNGTPIILDWKVNGYMSTSGSSPNKGYVMCRDGWINESRSKTHGNMYKDIFLKERHGIYYNIAPFEEYTPWADQLASYLWLAGEPVGTDALVVVHQLAWRNNLCRVADYRGVISEKYQERLFDRYITCWEDSLQGLGLSDDRRKQLETIAKQSASGGSLEQTFIEMTRKA